MPVLSLTLWMMAAAVEPSQVSSVVVYPDRAQVTRVQTVSCTGRTTVARASRRCPPRRIP
jgi:hypothetical protein